MKPLRAAALIALSFAVGGFAAEGVLRARREVARTRLEIEQRETPGSAGDLVALLIRGADGELFATPRLICAPGKTSRLVLRDPADPTIVRLSLRVEATREPTGFYSLDYALEVPGDGVASLGRVDLTPGVEQAIDLGGGALSAVVVAMPVPSAAFDAWLEAERERRLGAQI